MNCNKSIGLSFAFSLCLLLVLVRGYVKQELKSVSVKDAGFGTQLVLKSVSVSLSKIHSYLTGASLEPPPSSWQAFLITYGFVEEKVKQDDAYLTWTKVAVWCIGLTCVVAFCISYQHWQLKKLHWKSDKDKGRKDTTTMTTASLLSLILPAPEPEPVKPTSKKTLPTRGNTSSVKDKNKEILNLRCRIEQMEQANKKLNVIAAQRGFKITELETKTRKYERMLVICSTGLGIQSLSHMFR